METKDLKKIACMKQKNGCATKAALIAQERLWSERFYTSTSFVDDYTGEIDIYDEAYQEHLDLFSLSYN